jgi:hypothetical protein
MTDILTPGEILCGDHIVDLKGEVEMLLNAITNETGSYDKNGDQLSGEHVPDSDSEDDEDSDSDSLTSPGTPPVRRTRMLLPGTSATVRNLLEEPILRRLANPLYTEPNHQTSDPVHTGDETFTSVVSIFYTNILMKVITNVQYILMKVVTEHFLPFNVDM